MILATIWFRLPGLRRELALPNVEASYHTLLTDIAYDENPVSEHYFLPIITLGAETNKNLPWHGTQPTARGNYFYTSFTPAAFVAPYAFFKLFQLEPTLLSLAYFNMALGAVTALALYWLLCDVLIYLGKTPAFAAFCSVCAISIAIFSFEVLLSHGVNYWAHSLYQIFLVATFHIFFRFITQPSPHSKWIWFALAVVALAGCLVEWTAFITNAGMIAALWLYRRENPDARKAIGVIIAASSLAAAIILVYFSSVLGFWNMLSPLLWRVYYRSQASQGYTYLLLKGYGVSYGTFLLVMGAIFILQLFRPSILDQYKDQRRLVLSSMLLVMSFPVLENLILISHAGAFSFDRLKFIFPFALLTAIFMVNAQLWQCWVLSLGLLVASIQGMFAYHSIVRGYEPWIEKHSRNELLRDAIAANVDPAQAIYYSDSWGSCYSNLLFHKNINNLEKPDPEFGFGKELLQTRKPEAVVFLEAAPHFIGLEGPLWLPVYRRATILYKDGTTKVFDAEELEKSKK